MIMRGRKACVSLFIVTPAYAGVQSGGIAFGLQPSEALFSQKYPVKVHTLQIHDTFYDMI